MKSFSRIASLTLFTWVASFSQPVKTIRLAVIGGSVANAGFPVRLGVRLAADSVISYAYAGATVLKSGDSSYWTSGRLAQVFAYQPDIVGIQLGANDSKPVNWKDSANFERDYKALIDTLASMPSQPRILILYPTPVWTNAVGLQNSVMGNSILPRLRKIAKDKGTDTVDLYTPLLNRGNLFTADSINPNTAGNDTLGRRVFIGLVEQSVRVMCVGNSITQYTQSISGSSPKDAYPVRLNMMLGKKFWTWNGGRVGDWMQRKTFPNSGTYKSYITEKAWMDSLFALKPQYIAIKLGTNDSRMTWWNTASYISSYQYFIDTLYNNLTPKPKFFLIKPLPAWKNNGNWNYPPSGEAAAAGNGINGDIIRDSVVPAIAMVAASRPLAVAGVADMYTPFLALQSTVADGVHPNKTGQDSIAHILYRTVYPVATTPVRSHEPLRAIKGRANKVYLKGSLVPVKVFALNKLTSLDGRTISGNKPASGIYIATPKAGSKTKGQNEK